MSNYWATREVMTFDVDKFIADVCKKYEQMAQENPALAAWAKTEEELRKLWDAVLNVRRPGGDASLYPNQHGPQPALMEVWHKAGDFWRAKYRLGDKLLCDQNGAALSPTMLGWIAKAKAETEEQVYSHHTENAPAAAGEANTEPNFITDFTLGGAVREDSEPIFENNADDRDPSPVIQRRKKKAAEPKPQQLSLFDQELQEEQEEPAANKLMRGAGYLVAASVAIILVYQTGLIIPLGLIGLATSGLLR